MRIFIALIICASLSGCIVAGTQWRTVTNDDGEKVKQIRPCLYFVVCPPWDDPATAKAMTAPPPPKETRNDR